MQTIEQFDLSVLPERAQDELYDFYLFLRQRYTSETKPTQANHAEALKSLMEMTRKNTFKVGPAVDIRVLIDQTHAVELKQWIILN